MDYQRVHDEIISESRLTSPVGYRHRNKFGLYKERHHIIPRCLAGDNTPINLIYLTARRHFIVHRLLTKIHPNNSKVWYAYFAMFRETSVRMRYRDIGWSKSVSKEYEHFRTKMSEIQTGRKLSYETKLKISLAKLGKPFSSSHKERLSIAKKGTHRSIETKLKISKSGRGRRHSTESINKMKAAKAAHPTIYSEESRKKMSTWQKGRKLSEETKLKISLAGIGRRLSEETKTKLRGPRGPRRPRNTSNETSHTS